jgi:hypothetical protein
MNQRAGLLFLAQDTERLLLILEDFKWTVPTFPRINTLLEDSKEILSKYSTGKILPIELYVSRDNGFEYSTYICLTPAEFLVYTGNTYCWSKIDNMPKNLHTGLRNTLTNDITRTKIETILELQHDAT